MQISQKGIDLIKKFEGFSPTSYKYPEGKDTIGYGHSITTQEKGLTGISEGIAETLLQNDLIRIVAYINSAVRADLTQGRFDALCSLIYNWGCSSFGNSRGLQRLNESNYYIAAHEFFGKNAGVVNINGKFSNGLFRRRQAELEMWND
jgi:lysozyme